MLLWLRKAPLPFMQRMIRFKELCVRSIRVLFTALMVLALHSERVCAQSTADRISIKQRAVTLAGGETIDYEVCFTRRGHLGHRPSR